MPTQALNVPPTAWFTFDPGTESTMGFENTDSKGNVVIVIDTVPPSDVRSSSEIGHTLRPQTFRDFNFKSGEKAYLRSQASYIIRVTAL